MKASLTALFLWLCLSTCQIPSGKGSNRDISNPELETADAETVKKMVWRLANGRSR
jgi:hypothetical protein